MNEISEETLDAFLGAMWVALSESGIPPKMAMHKEPSEAAKQRALESLRNSQLKDAQ